MTAARRLRSYFQCHSAPLEVLQALTAVENQLLKDKLESKNSKQSSIKSFLVKPTNIPQQGHGTHAVAEPFSCSHCDKQFALSGDLKKHEGTHSKEQFTCLQCGKKFAIFSDLKQHKRTHAGEEPYSCSHCDKKFALLANLKQHERIHIGEKPFSCSNTDPQQHSPKQQEPFQQKSPHSSPPFHGWNPVECKLDRNKSQYETDEEEFEDLNEGFWEPPSTLVTPRKRPADDDYASSSRNCRPRLD